jgi:hypothetical protein
MYKLALDIYTKNPTYRLKKAIQSLSTEVDELDNTTVAPSSRTTPLGDGAMKNAPAEPLKSLLIGMPARRLKGL